MKLWGGTQLELSAPKELLLSIKVNLKRVRCINGSFFSNFALNLHFSNILLLVNKKNVLKII